MARADLPAGARGEARVVSAAPETTPQDERICGYSNNGTTWWCITTLKPGSCGAPADQRCDDNACWCGPAEARTWPGDDGSGRPLIAREAMQEHGIECQVVTHEDTTIGDCGDIGWVCRKSDNWCQDTADRGWSLTPMPPHRV